MFIPQDPRARTMSSSLFRHAVFETSVAKPINLPPAAVAGPEIAFAGRSNAGKSSAINTLAGHTRLAFVSKTPGRTQLINFFRLPNGACMVDLPGYGYAAVPEAVRKQWRGLLEHYLTRRENLIGLVLIMDSRRPLTDLDIQMIHWFVPTGNPIHILLTKSDKLSRQEATLTLRQVREAIAAYGGQVTVQLFSSLKKTGIEEAESVIGAWLDEETDESDETAEKEEPPVKGEKTGGQLP
ncbi:MAG: ribosome biogenesis GTP-binding protein YihA/YsxC [Proteobacteria bacterium]|nr:ribosome biogenesis GTP-binding protein YihA/YsxC [Pseudomonadota bacterium]